MIKVGLAEDHELVRKGLVLLLKSFNNVVVMFEVENGKELLEKLQTDVPDLLLLDIQMPVLSGIECCKIIREEYPYVKILMISHHADVATIRKAIESGAHGYFNKNTPITQLEHAIKSINEKDFYYTSQLADVVHQAIQCETKLFDRDADNIIISERETQVISLACKGYSSLEIACELNINVRTVETHRKRIMDKLGAKNFISVAIYALKHGLIQIDELES